MVLHLDHGEDFEICKACIDGGFTSVMIDGSKHSFEDNIALTRRVVEYAHAHDVVGTPMASFRAPPLALMSSTYLGVTEDAATFSGGSVSRT